MKINTKTKKKQQLIHTTCRQLIRKESFYLIKNIFNQANYFHCIECGLEINEQSIEILGDSDLVKKCKKVCSIANK